MSILRLATKPLLISVSAYFGILSLLIAFPTFQTHVFYLHRVTLTWFKDVNVPEAFGFLPGQVTSFSLPTSDGESLHAWHVLPLGAYRQNQDKLVAQEPEPDLAFKLLRDDPEARLVIYFHGTAGCIASGWRPDSYRTLSAAAPEKIHVLTADYRGYGRSSGTPSEEGLLLDAIALVNWATKEADISPSRIVIFGQSLGTAVAVSVSRHFALYTPSVTFAGIILVAPFSDVATLTGTYRIGGVVPVLSPLARFPPLLTFFTSFLTSTWMTKDRIAELVWTYESNENVHDYHITFVHAEDDPVVGCAHSDMLFWHAVNATTSTGIGYEELEHEKRLSRRDFGAGGWKLERKTPKGLIRQEMLKFGVHDMLMTFPTTSLAILKAFQATDSAFGKRAT
ncbi:Alpha/Beta hydrolase protein [Phyllosticta paracitricarpa]|uniref:Alpha/Beta hydrolase protein n=1 Tax=Phyllosticta paracitricarpa TaxID=2016321 RepID=A0ABR1N3X4_9PEZI